MAYYKSAGFDTSRVTAAAGDVLSGKTVIGRGGEVINGTIPVAAGGTRYATTSQQTLAGAGTYLSSDMVLSALSVSNLSAENIREGVRVVVNNGSGNVCDVTGTFSSSPSLSRVLLGVGGNAGLWLWQPKNGLVICSTQASLNYRFTTGMKNFLERYPNWNPYSGSYDYSSYGVSSGQVEDYFSKERWPTPSFMRSDWSGIPINDACTVLYRQVGEDWSYEELVTWLWIGKMKQDAYASFTYKSVNVMISP